MARDLVPAELARRGAQVDVVEGLSHRHPRRSARPRTGRSSSAPASPTGSPSPVPRRHKLRPEPRASKRWRACASPPSSRDQFYRPPPRHRVAAEAPEYTAEGLVNAILAYSAPDELMGVSRLPESRVLLTGIELDVFAASARGAPPKPSRKPSAPTALHLGCSSTRWAASRRSRQAGRRVRCTPEASIGQLARRSPPGATCTLFTSASWSTLTASVRAGTRWLPTRRKRTAEEWTSAHRRHAPQRTERASLVVQAVGAAPVHRMLDIGGARAPIPSPSPAPIRAACGDSRLAAVVPSRAAT